MKKAMYSIAVLIPILFSSCDSASTKTEETADTTMGEVLNSETPQKVLETFDYLEGCNDLKYWLGGIQGVETDQKTGPFIMAECVGTRTYDLIVFSEKDLTLDEGTLDQKIKSDIEGAAYYAFEIPKVENPEPADEFDTYKYVFPSEVKIYQKVNTTWEMIGGEEVHSFEELGSLKLAVVHQSDEHKYSNN